MCWRYSSVDDWQLPQLNDNKTEFILIGSKINLNKITIPHIKISDSTIGPVSQVRNLGVFMDSAKTLVPHIAHSHENGSSFFVLWSNNPCSLHKICNRINFLLDLDKIYTDIYIFLYFRLQIHTTFAPKDLKTRKMACPQRYTWFFQRYISTKMHF